MNYKLQIRRRRYCVRVVKITETPTHIPTLKVPGKQQTKFVQGQSNRKRREKHQRNIFLVEAKKNVVNYSSDRTKCARLSLMSTPKKKSTDLSSIHCALMKNYVSMSAPDFCGIRICFVRALS